MPTFDVQERFMAFRFEFSRNETKPDHRFLFVILLFGLLGAGAGIHWLTSGSIVIRQGKTRAGRATAAAPQPAHNAPAAGKIEPGDLAYYPLCAAWISLGTTMLVLSTVAIFSTNLIFTRLAAWTAPAILALAFTTVGLALWYGP
jgi:hypothetical protein